MQAMAIEGSESLDFLSVLLANDIRKTSVGKAIYTCMLNDEGGILDDLIAYRIAEDAFRLVLNAGCVEKDVAWIHHQAEHWRIARGFLSLSSEHRTQAESQLQIRTLTDRCILALQGPQSLALAKDCLPPEISDRLAQLGPMGVFEHGDWMVARTGYTGELGIELVLPPKDACEVWTLAMTAGVQPIGLGARDTLRLEAGLNLFGQDMTEATTPWESRLGWTVVLDPSRDFIGQAALIKAKMHLHSLLVPVLMKDRGVLRQGQTVWIHEGDSGSPAQPGVMTSGSFSPTLNCAIGFARIPHEASALSVEIRGRRSQLFRVDGPFVRQGVPSTVVKEILAS
jgi:aminomethyltransferase